jgi:hypothetical protein
MRALPLILLAGCIRVPIDQEGPGDYTTWKRVDITVSAPGHENSYRIIYINDLAADPAQSFVFGYQEGSVLVKEVRDDAGGVPGDLRYVAMMRRIGPVERALEDDGGWLFSESHVPNGPEETAAFCWQRCHVSAPYNGAWYDYRR